MDCRRRFSYALAALQIHLRHIHHTTPTPFVGIIVMTIDLPNGSTLKYWIAFTLVAGTLVACGSTPPAAAPATARSVPTIARATDVPAALATIAPAPTEAPTAEPATVMPAAVATVPPPKGVASQGSDCPADHPVKGNIVDRGATKGDKIYHMPGSGSYAATKPERCFLDAAEAESAGFRAPK